MISVSWTSSAFPMSKECPKCFNGPYWSTSLLELSFSVCNLSWPFWKWLTRDEYLKMELPSAFSEQKNLDLFWWHLDGKNYSTMQKNNHNTKKKYLIQLDARCRIGRIILSIVAHYLVWDIRGADFTRQYLKAHSTPGLPPKKKSILFFGPKRGFSESMFFFFFSSVLI